MKKAFIVEYSIRTRVIVDDEADNKESELIRQAQNNILNGPSSYINEDNIVIVEEDEDQPYVHEFDDPKDNMTIFDIIIPQDNGKVEWGKHYFNREDAEAEARRVGGTVYEYQA